MRSYTLGAAWWQGDCGPYWGHNAIIRIAPFMEHCHLPMLGKGAIIPGLAESWTVSEDGQQFVFKLRSGVKYHDGEPCEAADVKFTLDRLSAPDATAPGKSLYTSIKSVDVVDAKSRSILGGSTAR